MSQAQKSGRARSSRNKAASTSGSASGSASKTPAIRRVAIVGANRIPFARSNGPYADASNQDMLTAALDGLVSRFSLQNERIGEFAAGAVLKHSRDFNLAREVVLGSALAPTTPASDVQMACGTGLQAIVNVANKIALGQLDSAIAGGVDTTSDAPLAVNDRLRRLLVKLNSAKSLASGPSSSPGSAPATSCRRSPATPSRAPACRWVSTPPSPPRRGTSRVPTRTS